MVDGEGIGCDIKMAYAYIELQKIGRLWRGMSSYILKEDMEGINENISYIAGDT